MISVVVIILAGCTVTLSLLWFSLNKFRPSQLDKSNGRGVEAGVEAVRPECFHKVTNI